LYNQANLITSPAASITSYNSNQFMATTGSGLDFDKTQERNLLKQQLENVQQQISVMPAQIQARRGIMYGHKRAFS
jgi:hypothetical protein